MWLRVVVERRLPRPQLPLGFPRGFSERQRRDTLGNTSQNAARRVSVCYMHDEQVGRLVGSHGTRHLCQKSKQKIYASNGVTWSPADFSPSADLCQRYFSLHITAGQSARHVRWLAVQVHAVSSLAPDSSMKSNIGLPMHSLGVYSNEYHGRKSCPTHVAFVHGITASARATAVLDPILSARYFYLRYALVFLYILPMAPFLQPVTRESPRFVCLHFVQAYAFSHFCFILNRSCGPAWHSFTWLVYFCLTHLAGCESP